MGQSLFLAMLTQLCTVTACVEIGRKKIILSNSLWKHFISSKMTKLQMHNLLQGRSQFSVWVEGTAPKKGKLLLRDRDVLSEMSSTTTANCLNFSSEQLAVCEVYGKWFYFQYAWGILLLNELAKIFALSGVVIWLMKVTPK